MTPSSAVGPNPEEPADADPREFLIEVESEQPGGTMDLQVKYYACDDALTFCVPVTQDYTITLARDTSHGASIQTDETGRIVSGGNRARREAAAMGRQQPD